MGTRSLTRVMDEDGKPLLCLYRQMDGYPSGHGAELAEFLKGMVVVNGIGSNQPAKIANGMGCLTAQLVAHFKKGVGEFYVYQPDAKDCWEEYVYTVYAKDGVVMLRVDSIKGKGVVDKVLFDGKADDYVPADSE
jgi:hypothetical protein